MKALLLEDDFSLNQLISTALKNKGFRVQSFTNGYEASRDILNTNYDIYILDINVNGFDGHQVLSHIRSIYENAPVIIISAALDINNIQKSYSLGCNDYLKKPFDLEELFLRIQYLIKSVVKQDIDVNIDLGFGYSFSLLENKLFKFEHEIPLSQKESLLLSLLVRHINTTVTIEMIHEYVWESKELESVSMRSIIHKVQKKLKSGMIINIRGVGYKLLTI